VVTVDVSKVARLQRALKWASGTKQVSHFVLSAIHGLMNMCLQNVCKGKPILTFKSKSKVVPVL
jgi:hypothetical protein